MDPDRLGDARGTGYGWAYCYAVYDAATEAEAISAPPSGRDTPRTGCGGHPFSRMKRVAE